MFTDTPAAYDGSALACGHALLSKWQRLWQVEVAEGVKPATLDARFNHRVPRVDDNLRRDLTDGNASDKSPCADPRIYQASDIRIIKSYNLRKQRPIELEYPPSTRLLEIRDKLVVAINRAGEALKKHRECEHIDILNKVQMYLSEDQLAESRAFVSRPPIFDVIFCSEPQTRLGDSRMTGLVLHELYHFSVENLKTFYAHGSRNGPMGPGTPYETDAYAFQRKLGYPD